MRTTWITLWCSAVVAACGGAAPRGGAVVNAGAADADELAWLPPVARTLTHEPRARLAPSDRGDADPRLWGLRTIGKLVSRPCWPSLYDAVTAWYTVGVDGDGLMELDPVRVIRASWTPEQTACLVGPELQRASTKDPRIAAWVDPSTDDYDGDGAIDPPTPSFALVWLDGGWIGVGRDETHVAPLLQRPTADEHPLLPLIRPPFATEAWTATAVDFTGDLLGVPSLGVRAELANSDGTGEVYAQLVFADGASAQRAMTALRAYATTSSETMAFADGINELVARLERLGTLAVDGNAITFRGTLTFDDMLEATSNGFTSTSRPVQPRR